MYVGAPRSAASQFVSPAMLCQYVAAFPSNAFAASFAAPLTELADETIPEPIRLPVGVPILSEFPANPGHRYLNDAAAVRSFRIVVLLGAASMVQPSQLHQRYIFAQR